MTMSIDELEQEGVAVSSQTQVGIMVETPAAALMADVLAATLISSALEPTTSSSIQWRLIAPIAASWACLAC